MSDTLRCPDCGHENPAGSEACENCNFPLRGVPSAPPAASPPAPVEPAPSAEPVFTMPRPRRPPRQRPISNTSTTLWLFFGTVSAVMVIFIAFKGFKDSNPSAPIEGSSSQQMQTAEQARAILGKDSTNVEAHVVLADILYDTGNWSDAIVEYRAALRRDSTRVNALVDLGVCYFNLADPLTATAMFERALRIQPRQPVALFNLGIVAERQGDYKSAFSLYHRAMEAGGDENLRRAIVEAMQRATAASGMKAPPLDGGSAADSLPPGHPPVGGSGR